MTEDSDRATRPLGPKSHAPTIVTGFLSDTQNVLPTRLHERKEPAGGKRGPSLNRGWLIGGGVILAIAIGVAFLVTGGRDDSDVARSDATVTASVEPTAVAAVHGGVSPSAPVANGTTLGGQSIESTPGVSADVDREVTEEVLRLGGYVQYFDFSDHSKGSIESAQQIINKPFKVYLIGFRKPVSLSDSLTHKLRSLTRLQAVHFGAAVDDSTVENVASLVRVQQLAFFQRGESTDALSLLADLPQLTSLTIPSSILTEAHWLPQLSRLQALRIPYGIEPVEDAILMQCPQLRTIHFSGKTRPLTDDQCRMIQQQRPQHRFVQGNGAEARCLTADPTRDAAATLMKLGAKLEVVDLPYGASRSLKSADLESSRPFLPIDVCLPASVGWSPELEAALSLCHINGELRIPNRSQLRPYLVAVRDHQPGIETLDISHGTITDEDLALIAEMPGLRKLVATGTGLGPEDFTSLREPLPDCSIQLDERYLPAVSDTPQRMFR